MSGKSKSSTGKRGSKDPARPFDPAVMARAKDLAAKYQVVVRWDDAEQEFYGRGVELPLAMGDGKTADACIAHTREAMTAIAATMIEAGDVPPAPATEGTRSEQVNVRLSVEEKMLMEEAARVKGFKGLGDYLRAAGLAGQTAGR